MSARLAPRGGCGLDWARERLGRARPKEPIGQERQWQHDELERDQAAEHPGENAARVGAGC